MFSQNNTAAFNVQTGTIITGIDQIVVTPKPKTQIAGVIYVKEKTVMKTGTNTILKVRYLSDTKILAKTEKLITIVGKAKIQPVKKALAFVKRVDAFKSPLYYRFTGKSYQKGIIAQQQQQQQQSFKIGIKAKKQHHQTLVRLQCFFKNVTSCLYTYKAVVFQRKAPILSGYYSLPPPVKQSR